MLIAIEGVDGTGKSTLAEKLKINLQKKIKEFKKNDCYCRQADNEVHVEHFPNKATSICGQVALEYLQGVHLTPTKENLNMTISLLSFLQMAQIMEDYKLVRSKQIWIVDRYTVSAIAYLREHLKIENEPLAKAIRALQHVVLPKPDYLIFLNCRLSTSLERIKGKTNKDQYELDLDKLAVTKARYELLEGYARAGSAKANREAFAPTILHYDTDELTIDELNYVVTKEIEEFIFGSC